MAAERQPRRPPPSRTERSRRPPQRGAGPAPNRFTPAALQQRIGNEATHNLLSRIVRRPAPSAPAGAARETAPPVPAPEAGAPAPHPGAERPAAAAAVGVNAAEAATGPPASTAPPIVEGGPAGEGARAPAETGAGAPAAAAGAAGAEAAPPAAAGQSPAQAAAEPPAPGASEAKQGEEKAAEPEPAAPADPRQAVASTAAAVAERASRARGHASPATAVAQAQAAAIDPAAEQQRGAAVMTVQAAAESETGKVDKTSFREKLKAALAKAVPTPKNEEEAEETKEQGAGKASEALHGELDAQTQQAGGGLQAAVAPGAEVPPGAVPAPPESELVPEAPGGPPEPIAADGAVPPPLPPSQPDYSQARGETDRLMEEKGVSQQQLACANEPEFSAVLDSRGEAERREAEMPGEYRAAEAGILADQHAAAGAVLSGGLGSIHAVRSAEFAAVGGKQEAAKAADAAQRKKVTDDIAQIKKDTVDEVARILVAMDTSANAVFDAGLAHAETAYEEAFEEEKGGLAGWVAGHMTGNWDGMVEVAFKKAREVYDRIVSAAIDHVADVVERFLALAKLRVRKGREQVEAYVARLDESLRALGEQEQAKVAKGFDTLEGEIDKHAEGMIATLVDKFSQSLTRVAEVEERLREENKSLWDKIYDATMGVIDKILAFKDFLLSVLAKVGDVVEAIIADPIGFLGNLIEGITTGLDNFLSNIDQHLKKGLMDWLFGALAGAGLKLPETFDLKGILDLVLQILGLTWANIRGRLVRVLGEPMVAGLEKTVEIVTVLVREGPAGLWQMLVEKLGDIKDMLLEELSAWVSEQIFVAGVKWLLSLLNPVAAFIKACMAIYDIVKFFIERASQIMALVNAILDSMSALASGNVGALAKGVENALAKIIPVAIGFLAALLNISGITDKIREVIQKLQKPVNKAIDWLIEKVVALAKKAGNFVKDKAGKVVQWWKQRRKVKLADGETHTLSFEGEEGNAVLMLASEKKPVRDHLTEAIAGGLKDEPLQKAQDAVAFYDTWLAPLSATPPPANKEELLKVLPEKLNLFTDKLIAISGGGDAGKKPPQAKSNLAGPQSAEVELLSNLTSTGGKDASEDPKGWELLQDRGLTKNAPFWVRMHMISAAYGGSGGKGNLIPAPGGINTGVVKVFENRVKEILYGKDVSAKEARTSGSPLVAATLAALPAVIWLRTSADGFHPGVSDPETDKPLYDSTTFATSVTFAVGMHSLQGKEWVKESAPLASELVPIDRPDFSGKYVPAINAIGEGPLAKLARIRTRLAREICKLKPIVTPEQFEDKVGNTKLISEEDKTAAIDGVYNAVVAGDLRFGLK